MSMSLRPTELAPIPEETARVARAAFPKGTLFMRMRDELGAIYHDDHFAALYPRRGQPAEAPWRLALVLVMQFVENLADRQAADAVRSRIDWKYALGLELGDPGFDFSVLSEFRARLIAGGREHQLLETMLERFSALGLVKARGQQRTDSTHVLAAVRNLGRLENIGETLRAALNRVAEVAPDWLAGLIDAEWFERYGRRVEDYRLPTSSTRIHALAQAIGADGHKLLAAIHAPTAPAGLRALDAVETLRITWIQQFYCQDDTVTWRKADDLPPPSVRLDSPYDPDAHRGNKRSATWTGYKVHLTETCDEGLPHLIVHVATSPAPVQDVELTAPIHRALAAKGLLPSTHVVDAGYVDAGLVIASQAEHGIELLGPMRPDTSWQAKAAQGFDTAAFRIDWEARQATCPQGQTSVGWTAGRDAWGNARINISFSRDACGACPSKALCTRSTVTGRRMVTVRPREQHEALQEVRQGTEDWKRRYDRRAGIEGTLEQGVRLSGLRVCRYIGLPKTRLQHILTAAALNLVRLDAWITGRPLAKTRISTFAALQPRFA
jgi:transposase